MKEMRCLFSVSVLLTIGCGEDIDYTRFGESQIYSNYVNNSTRLYNDLFTNRGYNKYQSPVFALMPDNYTESPVPRFNVDIILWYLRIFDLDAQGQILSVCLEAILNWKDIRLAWDPAEYGGIHIMWANVDAVWIPENEIGDAKDLKIIHPDLQRTVQITANGSVMAPTVYFVEISCKVDVADFPFDRQECQVQFMVFSYDIKYVSQSGSINPNLIVENAGNGEWMVENVSIKKETYGTGTTAMDLFGFAIEMRRVPHFYIYVIAIPCFILTVLSIVGMFWTPNCKEEQLAKLGIGLTSLVSMTVLLDMVSQSIPRTSTFPLLGIYVVVCVAITALASVFVVSFCQERREMEKCSKLTDDAVENTWLRLKDALRQKRHHLFQAIFQIINLISFIVLLSFWR